VTVGGRRSDDPVEALGLPETLEGMLERPALFDPSVHGDSGAQRGVLHCFEQRHRDRDLLTEGRLFGVPERHDQEVGRDENRVLGARHADRRVEHGRVEAAREGDEDSARPGWNREAPTRARTAHERGRDHGRGNRDQ
jgi:hypothetical protein